MESLKDELKKKIKIERPKLRDSSLNAYVFNIDKLYRLMEFDDKPDNFDFLKDYEKVMKVLDEKKLSTRKTFLAAIVVSLMALDEDPDLIHKYRTEMEELADKNKEEQKKQKLSETQSDNWVNFEQLRKVMRKYRTEIMDRKLLTKDKLTKKEFDLVQKWVVADRKSTRLNSSHGYI